MRFAITTEPRRALRWLRFRPGGPPARNAAQAVIDHAHFQGVALAGLLAHSVYVSLGLLGLLAGARLAGPRARQWARAAYFAGIWLTAAGLAAASALYLGWSWLGIEIAIVAGLVWSADQRLEWRAVGLAAAWSAMGWCVWRSELRLHQIVWCALTLLFVVGRPRTGFRVRTRELGYPALSVALLLPTLAVLTFFYDGYEARSYERIVAQEGVQGLFKLSADDPIGRDILTNWALCFTRRATFLVEDCDPQWVYVAFQQDQIGLALLDLRARTLTRSTTRFNASDNLLLDCARGEIIVGNYRNRTVHTFAAGRLDRELRRRDSGLPTTVWLAQDPATREVYVTDQRGSIAVFDESEPASGEPGGRAKRVLDDAGKNNRLVRLPWAMDDRERGKYLLVEGGKILRRAPWPLAMDERRRVIYGASFEDGLVRAVAADSGDLLAQRLIEAGLRYVAYAARHDVVLVQGYISGRLYFLDPQTLAILASRYLGRTGRWITFSRDGAFAYVATAAGGFKIDLGRVLAAAKPGPSDPDGSSAQERAGEGDPRPQERGGLPKGG